MKIESESKNKLWFVSYSNRLLDKYRTTVNQFDRQRVFVSTSFPPIFNFLPLVFFNSSLPHCQISETDVSLFWYLFICFLFQTEKVWLLFALCRFTALIMDDAFITFITASFLNVLCSVCVRSDRTQCFCFYWQLMMEKDQSALRFTKQTLKSS